jgi:predicted secreted protein
MSEATIIILAVAALFVSLAFTLRSEVRIHDEQYAVGKSTPSEANASPRARTGIRATAVAISVGGLLHLVVTLFR